MVSHSSVSSEVLAVSGILDDDIDMDAILFRNHYECVPWTLLEDGSPGMVPHDVGRKNTHGRPIMVNTHPWQSMFTKTLRSGNRFKVENSYGHHDHEHIFLLACLLLEEALPEIRLIPIDIQKCTHTVYFDAQLPPTTEL